MIVDINKDEFESFKSKYIDMYDTLVGGTKKEMEKLPL